MRAHARHELKGRSTDRSLRQQRSLTWNQQSHQTAGSRTPGSAPEHEASAHTASEAPYARPARTRRDHGLEVDRTAETANLAGPRTRPQAAGGTSRQRSPTNAEVETTGVAGESGERHESRPASARTPTPMTSLPTCLPSQITGQVEQEKRQMLTLRRSRS